MYDKNNLKEKGSILEKEYNKKHDVIVSIITDHRTNTTGKQRIELGD